MFHIWGFERTSKLIRQMKRELAAHNLIGFSFLFIFATNESNFCTDLSSVRGEDLIFGEETCGLLFDMHSTLMKYVNGFDHLRGPV